VGVVEAVMESRSGFEENPKVVERVGREEVRCCGGEVGDG